MYLIGTIILHEDEIKPFLNGGTNLILTPEFGKQ